jgi:hypothetical protein
LDGYDRVSPVGRGGDIEPARSFQRFSMLGINLKFMALASGMQLLTVASVAHPTKRNKNKDGEQHTVTRKLQPTLSRFERRGACRP